MIIEIKVPSPGESVTEVEIGKWLVENGATVRKDQEVAEVESDKATLSLIATASGMLNILAKEGDRVAVGSVACTIDTERGSSQTEAPHAVAVSAPEEPVKAPVKEDVGQKDIVTQPAAVRKESETVLKMTPTAKAVMEQANLSVEEVLEGIRRLTRKDMEQIVGAYNNPLPAAMEASREEDRVAMTPLRRKLSQRLVAVKNETAMLTTFNEVDMSSIMELRNRFQKAFTEKYGFKLGFNAFFAKAVSLALSQHPSIR